MKTICIVSKNKTVFGGSDGTTAVSSVFREGTFNSKNFKKLDNYHQKALKWLENVKFRRKKAVFGGSGGFNLQNQKIRVCYHKTQLLSVITYSLTIKINPEITVYSNVSVYHPPSPLI